MKRWMLALFLVFIGLNSCGITFRKKADYDYSDLDWTTKRVHHRVNQFLDKYKKGDEIQIPPSSQIDSISVNKNKEKIKVYFNEAFSHIPFRTNNVDELYSGMKEELGWLYRNYSVEIYTIDTPISQLVPNYYRRSKDAIDPSRRTYKDRTKLFQKKQNKLISTMGLKNKNIALWSSHGWYYNEDRDRWEWQRPRLFQTVEDLLTYSYVNPYLVPMLEKAGANVFTPKERSLNSNEVIVDNDTSNQNSKYLETIEDTSLITSSDSGSGFSIGNPPYENKENPFKLGTFRKIKADTGVSATIEWIPNIPESGRYSVYISYSQSDNNVKDAEYKVYYSGGVDTFHVNQQINGGTWLHLGKYYFEKGVNSQNGKVVLINQSADSSRVITADAVRFGGGTGTISRNGRRSKRPRFTEAARYYLQYTGMPDSLVYNIPDGEGDYVNDYSSRGEWVNYLVGRPNGPNNNRGIEGLNVPIDMSLAIHTDAGISLGDSVIGTLGIYSIIGEDSMRTFPDGVSRLASRDLTDLIQTEIYSDIKENYSMQWTRRALYEGYYSEAYRPNIPAALIELFSHQNLGDMEYGLDPRFKFNMSRSIYKGILKYLSSQYQENYVVQPLPVTHFQARFTGEQEVTLNWKPQYDSLEKSAKPEKYIVYTRKGDQGFDEGRVVEDTTFTMEGLEAGINYSFKVTAANKGGKSFPSEILSVGWTKNSKGTVLIVNGFDRICGPEVIDRSNHKGFQHYRDEGVPYKYNMWYTGEQFNFQPESKFRTNDSPGWGNSHANYETKIIAGNTFDYPNIHGRAIKENGYSYISTSDEALMSGNIEMEKYPIVDLILGEEKTTQSIGDSSEVEFRTFPARLKEKVEQYCSSGGNLFLSGAYIGTDLYKGKKTDSSFAKNILHFNLNSTHASLEGDLMTVDTLFSKNTSSYNFNTDFHSNIYKVEAPDAISPVNEEDSTQNQDTTRTFIRYKENRFSAGIMHSGQYRLVITGFPFETILDKKERIDFMKNVLEYFSE